MLTKDDIAISYTEELKLIYSYYTYPPMCDEELCTQKAKNFFARSNGKALALCAKHEKMFCNATVQKQTVATQTKNFITQYVRRIRL